MDDDDYNDANTEESVKAQKATWTIYRKALRAYIAAADGTKSLPTAPRQSLKAGTKDPCRYGRV